MQFNGLTLIVEQQLDVPLMSGALFVFTNTQHVNVSKYCMGQHRSSDVEQAFRKRDI